MKRTDQQEAELSELRKALADYYNAKHTILESLELEIRKEKMKISKKQQTLTTLKTAV